MCAVTFAGALYKPHTLFVLLQIEEEQLWIKNETKLADGHTTEWDIGLADRFIQAAVKEWNISTVSRA